MTEVMVMLRDLDQTTELILVHRGWLAFRGEKGTTTRPARGGMGASS